MKALIYVLLRLVSKTCKSVKYQVQKEGAMIRGLLWRLIRVKINNANFFLR